MRLAVNAGIEPEIGTILPWSAPEKGFAQCGKDKHAVRPSSHGIHPLSNHQSDRHCPRFRKHGVHASVTLNRCVKPKGVSGCIGRANPRTTGRSRFAQGQHGEKCDLYRAFIGSVE